MQNPLLDHSALPRFSKISPDHVEPAVDSILEDSEGALWIGTTGGGLQELSAGAAIAFGRPGEPLGRRHMALARALQRRTRGGRR